ncbi:6,7-dimethyl-8-ribityllumazine synthase [bacterium]|nr:6,7-dimethyl-8-ribityllumazine synthase [bacterium]
MRQKTKKLKDVKKPVKKIALVVARYNQDICDAMLHGAVKSLKEAGVPEQKIDIIRVPGAFELPYAVQKLALTKKYGGVVALGVVIRGDTPHFDFVCQGATQGLMQVMLACKIPVGFGVITTNNLEQALARSRDDEYNKGREAALTVLEMMSLS